MYLSSACWKLTDPIWRAGDALAFVLRMRLHTGELADTVALLPVPVLRTLSWASLVTEAFHSAETGGRISVGEGCETTPGRSDCEDRSGGAVGPAVTPW